eukprot:CAMPEP_0114614398 /NCGR_PEP_ID=MMETSP0168-20121206/5634_1 /TAXON_ID=95228 ORGANISM="Vannella sp., Strain DIVA3 517/6/12" /NCGR_SAMPLE_ID=MMETSP0168 /ASSEMBLY_ACC=CAM_ASM_000044 /LENGTH=863 /DNA_ID=CAMNT_0001825447 /DNA_START=55 /DNA_END=2644 /DNA_ORIENTATION=+
MKGLLKKKQSSGRQNLLGGSRERSPTPKFKAGTADPAKKRLMQKDNSLRNSFKGITAFRPNADISKAALESLESPITRDAYYRPTKGDTFSSRGLRPVSVISSGGALGKDMHLRELQRMIALEGEKYRQEMQDKPKPAEKEKEETPLKNVSFGASEPAKVSTIGRSAGGRAPAPAPFLASMAPTAPAPVPPGARVPVPVAALEEPAPAAPPDQPQLCAEESFGGKPKFKLVIKGHAASDLKREQARNRPQSIFLLNNVSQKKTPAKRTLVGRARAAPRPTRASPRVSMFISTMQGLEDPEEKVKQFEDFFGTSALDEEEEEAESDDEGEETAGGAMIDDWYGDFILLKVRRSKSMSSIAPADSYSVDADLVPPAVLKELQRSSTNAAKKVVVRTSSSEAGGEDLLAMPTDMAPQLPEVVTKPRSGSIGELPVPEDDEEEAEEESRAEEVDVVYEKVQNGTEELLVIQGGTKEKLLQNLVDVHFQDIDFINQMIYTHHYFCLSMEMLNYLFEAFREAATTKAETEKVAKLKTLKQKRIMFILAKWMRACPEDFCGNKEARRAIRAFPKMKFVASEHQKALQRQIKLMKTSYKQANRARKKRLPQAKAAQEPGGAAKNVFQARTADELAQQLTVAEHHTFAKITSAELRHKMWSDKDADALAPNIHRTIQRFNEISFWVASEIVVLSDLRDRVRTLKKFIHVVERCIFYRNFNGAMSILSGLNNGAVSRLKRTWKMLPPKYTEMYDKVMQFFSMEKSYKLYRSILVTKSPPLIPYLGVNLKDLTFMEDGNPDFLDDGKRIINFEKYRMIASIIAELLRYQQATYRIVPDPEIQYYLDNMVILSEKQLYTYSQRVENRNTVQNRRQ